MLNGELEKSIVLLVTKETMKMQQEHEDFATGMAQILASITSALAVCAAGAFMCSGMPKDEVEKRAKKISEHIGELVLERYNDAIGRKEKKEDFGSLYKKEVEKKDNDTPKPRFNFN
jgi:hypothetical protein